MQRPDVTLVTPYPPAGERHGGFTGVASYSANLAHALAARGRSVTVIAPREDGEPELATDGPVRVERRFARGARAVPAAARAARSTGAPVVHLQHETFLYGGPESVPGTVSGLARLRLGGTRTVVTMHHVVQRDVVDTDFTRLHRVSAPPALARAGLSAVGTAIGRLADRVIVHEPGFADSVRGATVVPHGVEPALTPPRAEARARLGLNRFTVLCFGFVAPYKGLEPALAAARLAGADVEAVVVGDEHPRLRSSGDPYLERLRAGNPHARFAGRAPDAAVADWFAAADLALFLYPRPVSSSGALALALAHGTPFLLSDELATTCGAACELIASRDPLTLAATLRALAEDRHRLEQLRDAGATLAHARDWDSVASRHADIYEEVTDADRTPGRRIRAA